MKPVLFSTDKGKGGGRGLLNIKGILLLAAALAVCDLAVAYGLSPLTTSWAVNTVNRYTNARIVIRDLRLHPVLLTLTARTIEAADPDRTDRRMFLADSLRASIDPIALLAGKVFLGSLTFRQVELVLEKDAQGTFNVEKLVKKDARTEGSGKWTDGVKDFFKQRTDKDDWFGDTYGKAKDWVKKSSEKKNDPRIISVREEPRGRIVNFSSLQDPVFRIGEIRIAGGRLVLSDRGGSLPPLEDLRFNLKSFVMRRSGGFDFAEIGASGRLKEGAEEGSFDLDVTRSEGRIRSRVKTTHLDLAPLRALYEESSPVAFERGFLTLDCRSELTAQKIDSQNELKLEDYKMVSASNGRLGPVPISLVVDTLNRRKELELKFTITGDPEHPSMNGFETTLWNLVKDDLGSQALETLESKTGVNLSTLSEKLKKLF